MRLLCGSDGAVGACVRPQRRINAGTSQAMNGRPLSERMCGVFSWVVKAAVPFSKKVFCPR